MADMTFFDGFSFTWASDGPVATLSQEAVKVGWNFIGQTPPAVEQFNAVHHLDGQRQQWLFGQIKGVTDAAGMTLVPGATGTLWDALYSKFNIGFTPVQQGGGAGQSSNKVHIGWGGSAGLKAQVDGTDLGSFVFASRQFTAGAGLTGGGTFGSDRVISMGTPSTITTSSSNSAGGASHSHALDISLPAIPGTLPVSKGGTGANDAGQARANLGMGAFLKLAELSLAENGFARLGTDNGQQGLILQWGRYIPSSGMPEGPGPTINFPTPFPGGCLTVVTSERIAAGNAGIDAFLQVVGQPSATQFQTYIQKPGDASANWSGMFWFAVGY
jgi:hypothetical protein